MSETIRERKDIPLKDTWALEDLYATDADWEKALARMQARMPELSEGEPAVKDYLGFLSGGCSKSPIDLLKGAGVDMTSPAPVNDALKLFGELLDEMESLMAE